VEHVLFAIGPFQALPVIAGGAGAHHMVVGQQVIVAEIFHCLGKGLDRARVCPNFVLGEYNANFHDELRWKQGIYHRRY